MVTVEDERRQVLCAFKDVEELESLAQTLQPAEARRIYQVTTGMVSRIQPVRPRIAAELLKLSEKTVRGWVREGVLNTSTLLPRRTTRMLLDPSRLHEVLHLVENLRATGQQHDLLDAVWRHLQDQALLDREDLQESLEQMRRGELTEI